MKLAALTPLTLPLRALELVLCRTVALGEPDDLFATVRGPKGWYAFPKPALPAEALHENALFYADLDELRANFEDLRAFDWFNQALAVDQARCEAGLAKHRAERLAKRAAEQK